MGFNLTSPPPYLLGSDETTAPGYSSRPLEGEHSLEYRPRVRHALESGPASDLDDVFIHYFDDNVTVVLDEQHRGIPTPIYRKNSRISGTVLLSPKILDHVASVVLEASKVFCQGLIKL